MSNYSQIFTLEDIFSNPRLKNKLPMIRIKENERESGRVSITSQVKTVGKQIFDTSVSAARPYYKPLLARKQGDMIIIGGELKGEQDDVVNAVYNALMAQRLTILYTANNADMIRDAMKESAKNKRLYGTDTKLYLRAQSMAQIEGMTNKEIQALLNNVMENLIYSDNFPRTQRKYGVGDEMINPDYNQQRLRWKQRVGDL